MIRLFPKPFHGATTSYSGKGCARSKATSEQLRRTASLVAWGCIDNEIASTALGIPS